MTSTSGAVIATVEGIVSDIVVKGDKNGKEFVTVSIQQGGSNYPTNARSRDAGIIGRMVNAKKHMDSGTTVWLSVDVTETPRAEGGVFRDIIKIVRATLDDVPQEPATPSNEDARPVRQSTPVPTVQSWGSLDERIAWNSAINNAVHAVPYHTPPYTSEIPTVTWLKDVTYVATNLYPLIRRGPAPVEPVEPVEDAPEIPVEAPEPAIDIPVDLPDPLAGETPPNDLDELESLDVFEV
jgi:hypothetical protein